MLLVLSRRGEEKEAVIEEDEWEIQGELDPEDAVECTECGDIYPLWLDRCPGCGERNIFD